MKGRTSGFLAETWSSGQVVLFFSASQVCECTVLLHTLFSADRPCPAPSPSPCTPPPPAARFQPPARRSLSLKSQSCITKSVGSGVRPRFQPQFCLLRTMWPHISGPLFLCWEAWRATANPQGDGEHRMLECRGKVVTSCEPTCTREASGNYNVEASVPAPGPFQTLGCRVFAV